MLYEEINKLLGTEYRTDKEIDWSEISNNCNLREDFIEEFKDKLDWYWIGKNQTLSEPFIDKYKQKLNWEWISTEKVLSEPFMEKYKDWLDWDGISIWQLLSPEFIKKYKDKLNKKLILEFQPFIKSENPKNLGSQVYQKTKDQGWFIGYKVSESNGYFGYKLVVGSENYIRKVKIYWKDLDLTHRTKKYELIRLVKYV